MIDLHMHSTYSDGVYKPAELIAMAAAKGLKTIALADHDTVDGIDEALEAGRRHHVEVIPAVELSVQFETYKDVHLLGYLIDHRDSAFLRKLAEFRTIRDRRGQAIIANINQKLGQENKEIISYDEAMNLADGAFGRPHIARVLVNRGYARDMQDAFERYLIPCDEPKRYFPMDEALAEIDRLGGIAVLAHPTSVSEERKTLAAVIGKLAEMGLRGVEAHNNMCNADESAFLVRLAENLGLAVTGGSDFHGIEPGIEMGTGRGQLAIPHTLATALKCLHHTA
ncbi:PHP domain-containing protein [Geotalea sp. SG265]|uniref:PHP domain-containing protein n=1 Tax=Geotalea sp. SG265 TaxID=2922867 RepID=UPI001FAEEF6D|nr:PHP domain-containing protein [Geotalea sp. SG265]